MAWNSVPEFLRVSGVAYSLLKIFAFHGNYMPMSCRFGNMALQKIVWLQPTKNSLPSVA